MRSEICFFLLKQLHHFFHHPIHIYGSFYHVIFAHCFSDVPAEVLWDLQTWRILIYETPFSISCFRFLPTHLKVYTFFVVLLLNITSLFSVEAFQCLDLFKLCVFFHLLLFLFLELDLHHLVVLLQFNLISFFFQLFLFTGKFIHVFIVFDLSTTSFYF